MSTFDEAVNDIKKAKSVLEGKTPEPMSHPDPKKHLYISLAKSVIRIGAGVALILGFPLWCGVGIVAAEALGIVEELV
jgi:hypothetical protein